MGENSQYIHKSLFLAPIVYNCVYKSGISVWESLGVSGGKTLSEKCSISYYIAKNVPT